MKISFPKCGGELVTRKRLASWIIAFVVIGLVASVCGSSLLGNKVWLLAIAVLGIAGIVLCLGAAAANFLNQTEVKETPSAFIEENVPQISSQWDYQPSKPIRRCGVLNSPSSETSDDLTSDPFGINDNVWFNDNSLEGGACTFINDPPEAEEPITKPLPQTTDSVGIGPTTDDAAVLR